MDSAHFAAINKQRKGGEILKLLLEAGLEDVHRGFGDEGLTPLMLAAQRGREEVCKRIVEKDSQGINRVSLGTGGRTATFMALEKGHVGVVKILVEAGADVRIGRVGDGVTCLHLAASKDSPELCEVCTGDAPLKFCRDAE